MNKQAQLPINSANKELLKGLIEKQVNFIIIGGVAVHFYSPDRQVADLDILIERTKENAEKVMSVVASCPLIKIDFTSENMLSSRKTQIPVKIYFNADILTPGDEIDYYHHLKESNNISIDEMKLKIASIESLITLLKLSNEKKHINDIEILEKINANK